MAVQRAQQVPTIHLKKKHIRGFFMFFFSNLCCIFASRVIKYLART